MKYTKSVRIANDAVLAGFYPMAMLRPLINGGPVFLPYECG